MKSLESEILEARESEDKHFKTFKGVRGQLIKECQEIKDKAYQQAYEEVMETANTLKM